MASGNMFLGQASGSVGDVTFYTSGGRQRSRVRRRVIANPRSSRQLIQRAILSTVMQAYTAGKEIFDHSFEGLSVPNECKNRFQSLNMRLLRQQLAADFANIDDASYKTVASVVPPRATMPVPNGYIVSEGSLPVPSWPVVESDDESNSIRIANATFASGANLTVREYLAALGVSVGDIITIVSFAVPIDYDGAVDDPAGYSAEFKWLRMECIGDNLDSPAVQDGQEVDDLLSLCFAHSGNHTELQVYDFGMLVTGATLRYGGSRQSPIGVIYSRKDSPLRSPCTLTPFAGGDASITARDLLDVWSAGTVQINAASDLILEGGDV